MKTIHACESTTMSWLFPGKKMKKIHPWKHHKNGGCRKMTTLPFIQPSGASPMKSSMAAHCVQHRDPQEGSGWGIARSETPFLHLSCQRLKASVCRDTRIRLCIKYKKIHIYIYVNLTNVSLNISYGLKRLLRKIFGKKKKMAKGHTKLYWYAILKLGFCAASTHPIGYWKWYAYWTCQKNSAVSFTPQTPQKVPCKGFHQRKKDENIKIKIFPEIPRKKTPFQNQNPKNKHHLEHLFPGWFIKLSQPTPPHHPNHCFPSTDCSSCGFRSLLDLAKWPIKEPKDSHPLCTTWKIQPQKIGTWKIAPLRLSQIRVKQDVQDVFKFGRWVCACFLAFG